MKNRWLVWALALMLSAPVAYAAQEGVCESQDGRYRECRMPFSGTAQLSKQLSSTACEQGRTWGQRSSGVVWVSGGCRARFEQAGAWWGGDAVGSSVQTLRCESTDGRRKVCRFNTDTRGQVALKRQLSKTDCVEGRNWGRSGSGAVWVSGGCRAEFEVAASGWQQGSSGQTVRCSSHDSATSYCQWNSSWGRPVLHRQLSSAACEQGRTWGYGLRGLWVSGGCRAEFAPDSSGSAWKYGGSSGQTVRCSSHDGATSYCEWKLSWGQPRLLRQLSSAACEQGRTWGYGLRGIWVSNGCRGEFGN